MIGYIYKIVNSVNDKCYIGSTLTSIKHRWAVHRSHYKCIKKGRSVFTLFDEVGIDNCSIELLQEEECVDQIQLRQFERLWYEIIPNNVNTNKPHKFKHEFKEYQKKWRLNHPNYANEWKSTHEGYFDKYRQDHMTIVECPCGSMIKTVNGNIKLHCKTKRHQNFEYSQKNDYFDKPI